MKKINKYSLAVFWGCFSCMLAAAPLTLEQFDGNEFPDFVMRDNIRKSLGKELPENKKAKLRLYNCEEINTKTKNCKKYIEIHETTDGAPDMPTPCRKLLDSLPK